MRILKAILPTIREELKPSRVWLNTCLNSLSHHKITLMCLLSSNMNIHVALETEGRPINSTEKKCCNKEGSSEREVQETLALQEWEKGREPCTSLLLSKQYTTQQSRKHYVHSWSEYYQGHSHKYHNEALLWILSAGVEHVCLLACYNCEPFDQYKYICKYLVEWLI